jgi:2-polyprenyl-6-methoxyphenol hydroxylase-like FAD-dependent oxidoreductase
MDSIDSSLIPLADELVMEHSQVIIIGAGPVGLLTALKLAKEGIQVTVIEVERQVLQSPRATT